MVKGKVALEGAGAVLRYLPPYILEFNPIEQTRPQLALCQVTHLAYAAQRNQACTHDIQKSWSAAFLTVGSICIFSKLPLQFIICRQ